MTWLARERDGLPNAKFAVLVFVTSLGSYMLLAGNLAWTEATAGVAVAAAVTGFATAWRLRQGRRIAPVLPPGRVLLGTLASLVTDTLRVGAALLAAPGARGAAGWQAFRPGSRSSRNAGRRALVTLLTSAAPNGIVLDLRPSAMPEVDNGLLLHRLVPAPPLSGADWPA